MSDSKQSSDNSPLSNWLDGDNPLNAPLIEETTHRDVEESDRVADELVIHGLLSDAARHDQERHEFRITRVLSSLDESVTARQPRLAILGSVVALAACLLLGVFLFQPRSATAAVALTQIIETAFQRVDRAYRIKVVEEYTQRRNPRNLPEERWLVRPAENVDDAVLYVGGEHLFVFSRKLTDGRRRVTGCDAKVSWAFREDGPVHISDDLTRFRGGLPGQQQNLGFSDLYTQLTSLQEGYEIELVRAPNSQLDRLVGSRVSRDVRGPKSVEIDFDPEDGLIHRMFFDGLPRGRGGPKSVTFELISREKQADSFYSHASHHDGKRRVKYEGNRR